MTKSKKTKVDDVDMWIVLLSTIRYSLGRSTYMTSLSWELVLKYKDCLSTSQLQQISREIIEEITRYNKFKQNTQSDIKSFPDEETWLRGYKLINDEISKREVL